MSDDRNASNAPQQLPAPPSNAKRDRALILRAQGLPYATIAEQLSVNKSTVLRWCRAVALRTATSLQLPVTVVTRADIQRRIFELAPDCVSTLDALRQRSTKDDVRLRASTDLLDRAGFAPVQRSLQVHAIEEMSRAELLAGIAALLGELGPALPAGLGPASPPDVGNDQPIASTRTDTHTQAPEPATPCARAGEGGVCTESPDQGPTHHTSGPKSQFADATAPAAPASPEAP